jgi:hypothetical protein
MSWFPDVISAAYIITRPVAVVRPIAYLYRDGARLTPIIRSAISWNASIVGSITRVGAVIASTSY